MQTAVTVPVSTIVCMVCSLLAGIAIPVVLFLVMRAKGAKPAAFFVGCGVMFLFAFVLEQLVHAVFFALPVGNMVVKKTLLYAAYGGFMAALFEEFGRLAAFGVLLRKHRGDDVNALMYGAGHGGFEALYLLGLGMLNNLIVAIMLNAGMQQVLTGGLSGDALANVQNVFLQLAQTPAPTFLVGIVERLGAVTVQICLSVLVWFAVKRGAKGIGLFVLAFFLHMALDFAVVVLSAYSVPILLIELFVWIFAAACVLIARSVWRHCHQTDCDAANT